MKFLLIGLFVSFLLEAQMYKFEADYQRNALAGNGVIRLAIHADTLWTGGGGGLTRSTDRGRNFTNYDNDDYGGKGSISALDFHADGRIFIAMGYDSTISDEDLDVGGGLAWSADGGDSWQYINQPVDPRVETDANNFSEELGYYPTTTRVLNITYALAVTDNYLWTTSFAGGLRRLDLNYLSAGADSFKVVTPDGRVFNAQNLSHRMFAVANLGNMLAVGSAEGVAVSMDEGTSWQNYGFANNDSLSLPGNFIVSLDINPADGSIWAGCLESVLDGEKRGLAFSRNNGLSWQRRLPGLRIYDVAFFEGYVYASTENGLYYSADDGNTWVNWGRIEDFETGEFLTAPQVYVAEGNPQSGRLWLGTADGLAMRDGSFWRIFRSYSQAGVDGEDLVYAYPNPYSPDRVEFVRFQYRAAKAGRVTLDIYNFAMEKVIRLEESVAGSEIHPDRSIKWNGKDSEGRTVDNGVYFFRASTPAGKFWGKVVIIN
jgi:hypothetical protein